MTDATSIMVRVPLTIRRRPGRKTVVTPVRCDGDAAIATLAEPALVKALARAFRYQKMLDEGRYASITEMAAAEKIERGYLGSLLRLTLLAPDIVEAIFDGSKADEISLPSVMEPFVSFWAEQRMSLSQICHTEVTDHRATAPNYQRTPSTGVGQEPNLLPVPPIATRNRHPESASRPVSAVRREGAGAGHGAAGPGPPRFGRWD